MINNMDLYGGRSVMAMIAGAVDELILSKRINEQTLVAIFGLTKLSFCIRTVLSKRNIRVAAYVSSDEKEIIETKRYVKTFASRYLNGTEDVIPVISVSEWKGKNGEKILLCAQKRNDTFTEYLTKEGLVEGIDFACIYDGVDKSLETQISCMKRMSLEDIKNGEKEILRFIDEFCGVNDLKYWVCGGTMLGTIRHKGFIPWDDDIDIFLPWVDYKRFLEIFPKDNRYVLETREDKNPQRHLEYFSKIVDSETLIREDQDTYQKISGVWVDIFPLCGLPDDEAERGVLFARFREIEKEMWESFYTNDGSFDGFSKYYKEQYELLDKYDFDSSKHVGVPGTAYGSRDQTSRHVYDETVRMQFEDIEVNAPIGYDEYLSNLYGDYMTLPKEVDRVSNHTIEAYM